MNKRVLLIEDDKLLLELYQQVLKQEKITAEKSRNYQQAIKRLKQKTYDLVVLDVILGERNGFQLLRDMRKLAKYSQTPVMIVTGLHTADITISEELKASLNIVGIYSKSNLSIELFAKTVQGFL